MQLYTLDYDPKKSAEYIGDRHLVDICKTYGQMACTALFLNGVKGPLKPIYKKDPIVLWLASSRENFLDFLLSYEAVLEEYKFRYNKRHKYYEHFSFFQEYAENLPDVEWTTPPLCIPKKYFKGKLDEDGDVDYVGAFREYYVKAKCGKTQWNRTRVPEWYEDMFREHIRELYKKKGNLSFEVSFISDDRYLEMLTNIILEEG